MAYGETFLLCIPKEVAEKMDAANSKLQTVITASMNVDRYDVFVASTNAGDVQPVILVEPAVKQSTAQLVFVNQEVAQGTIRVRILKTDEAGAGLEGCTFELTIPPEQAADRNVLSIRRNYFCGFTAEYDCSAQRKHLHRKLYAPADQDNQHWQ